MSASTSARDAKNADNSPPQDYCAAAVASLSVDRTQADRAKLVALGREIEARKRELEAAISTLKQWVEQRTAFRNQAQEAVVQLYSRMSSEAASVQLAAMDIDIASAILSRLDPRVASAILAEMDAGQAARISAVLANVADLRRWPSKTRTPANASGRDGQP